MPYSLWTWKGTALEKAGRRGPDGASGVRLVRDKGCDPCAGKDATPPSIFDDFKCGFDPSKVSVIRTDTDYPGPF